MGRMYGITSSINNSTHPSDLLTDLAYNAAGRVVSGRYGNGRQIRRDFNTRQQLQYQEVKDQEAAFANSGFEEGTGSDAANWSEGPSMTRSSERSLTGRYSLKSSASSTAVTMTSNYLTVQPSTTYTVSGYVYIESYGEGSIYLDLRDGIGQGQNFTDAHAVADTTKVGRWQRVSAPFSTAAATTGVTVRVVFSGTGSTVFYADELSLTKGSRAPAAAWTYDYWESTANTGHIREIFDQLNDNRSASYQYDGYYRLTRAETAEWGLNWSYDEYGNRTGQTAFRGAPPTFTTSVNPATNRVTGWSYDAAGNVTNDGLHTYQYDAENRLIRVDGGVTASYQYNAFGERVVKTVGATTSYQYWGVAERTGTGVWSYYYVNGPMGKLVQYSSSKTWFYANDHLGTPAEAMDWVGEAVQSYQFYPFGERQTGGNYHRHQFTGKEYDPESNLHSFGARYLETRAGRWMSPDPSRQGMSDPQTLNMYAYVGNDPVNYVDPDGRFRCAPASFICVEVIGLLPPQTNERCGLEL